LVWSALGASSFHRICTESECQALFKKLSFHPQQGLQNLHSGKFELIPLSHWSLSWELNDCSGHWLMTNIHCPSYSLNTMF